jgi:hypothetical protein
MIRPLAPFTSRPRPSAVVKAGSSGPQAPADTAPVAWLKPSRLVFHRGAKLAPKLKVLGRLRVADKARGSAP